MRPGLVTYQWGKDWDLPTLIANCAKTSMLGVEQRTQIAHGVETSLNAAHDKEKGFHHQKRSWVGRHGQRGNGPQRLNPCAQSMAEHLHAGKLGEVYMAKGLC